MSKKILLINGPNLNLLGTREPEIYGYKNLKDIENSIKEVFSMTNLQLISFQSNHEGNIIDFIHENKTADYIIINPAGLTHTSVSLRDALTGVNIPFLEVHISNIYAREDFRKSSYLSPKAAGVITGCGIFGYVMAATFIKQHLASN